jgi:hypothetical protein
VFSGVKEFSIDVTELSISVCAIAKRKKIKVPNIEVIAINFHFSFGIFDKLLKPISKKQQQR